ncbi:hypothetical protein Q9189_006778 [Teloschistes chrysophthalmus]
MAESRHALSVFTMRLANPRRKERRKWSRTVRFWVGFSSWSNSQHSSRTSFRVTSVYAKPVHIRLSKRSTAVQDVFHLPDGPMQQERDRQMCEKTFNGHLDPFADPPLLSYIYDYDAFQELKNDGLKVRSTYKAGPTSKL